MIKTAMTTLNRFESRGASTEFGAFLLRMTLVAIWIAHFWYKVGYRGMPLTVTFFKSLGYPGWFAWADIIAEVIGIAMLFLGVYVRTVSLLLLIILVPATLVWVPKGFYFVNAGYEFMLTWCVLQVIQGIMGAGAYRLHLDVAGPGRIAAAK